MGEQNPDTCEVFCVDEEKIGRMKQKLAGLPPLAPLFKVMGDETRVRILYALGHEEMCVCDVAQMLGTNTANASHHLRVLRSAGLARCRKEGKLVYYALDDDHVRVLLETALEHVKEVRCDSGPA